MLILVPGSVVCVCLHVVLHSVFRSQQPDSTEAGTAKVDKKYNMGGLGGTRVEKQCEAC